jgi:hypothetical protein
MLDVWGLQAEGGLRMLPKMPKTSEQLLHSSGEAVMCACGGEAEKDSAYCSECLEDMERQSGDNPYDESWRFQ